MRRGTAPAAIVLLKPNVNVAVGAMIASALYGVDLPVIALLDAAAFARLMTGAQARVAADGTLTLAGAVAGAGTGAVAGAGTGENGAPR
jgi:predicted aconitase with swiveling domain